MSPWSCDDIVTCDNFEYMVRPWAEALLLLAVTRGDFSRRHSPRLPTRPPADRVLVARAPQETATFATTGGHVWPAARRLVEYFEAVADDIGLSRPGAQIVELGAGTGWLSVALAKNLPNAERVVATEMRAGGALRWLRRNVCANERIDTLATEECDWSTYLGGEPTKSGYGDDVADDVAPKTDAPRPETEKTETETETETARSASASSSPSTLDSTAWDFIVGSDLVYDDSGVAMLPRVFRRLLDNAHANARAATDGGEKNATGPPPAAYYAHTKYRYELRDIEFFAEMSRRGLVMTEVREPNAPSPPASPEPLSQLFPEKRVAVFRIERREDVDRESR